MSKKVFKLRFAGENVSAIRNSDIFQKEKIKKD